MKKLFLITLAIVGLSACSNNPNDSDNWITVTDPQYGTQIRCFKYSADWGMACYKLGN